MLISWVDQTYAVEMHGVRATEGTGGHGDLHRLAHGEVVDEAGGEQVLGGLRAAHDLKEDGDVGRTESLAVDVELARNGVLPRRCQQISIVNMRGYVPLRWQG